MASLNTSLGRRTGRPKEPDRDFDPRQVLAGLSPRLVIDLARLAGSSLQDLQTTCQVLPWGDRATLAAYDVVDLGPVNKSGRRSLTVRPEALDLVQAAAAIVAEAASPDAVARILDPTYSEPAGPVPVEAVNIRDLEKDDGRLIEGVVEGIHVHGDDQVLEVALGTGKPGSSRTASHSDSVGGVVFVSTDLKFRVHAASPVVLQYEDDLDLTTPRIIAKVGT